MKHSLWCWLSVFVLLTACTYGVPYRNGEYAEIDSCAKVYNDYDNKLSKDHLDESDVCWEQSREKHRNYDLFFVEFDDQGWVQGAAHETSPIKKDHLSNIFDALTALHKSQQRLSIVTFVHGWKHNAQSTDLNVHAFRMLLDQVDALETAAHGNDHKPRVVGIYVGWRGKSLIIPYLDNITFWDRKNTAEKVAHGQVQELFLWLDWLRDTVRGDNDEQYVSVLTIGHSFGGLITFEALNSEFIRNGVRFKRNNKKLNDRFMSRVGDLVVIVNPAFEGARYEALRAVSRRFPDVERNQLPVVIVATSDADWATKVTFPLARWFGTIFEPTTGPQQAANVKTVGHNSRYITHELSLCNSPGCENPCKSPSITGNLESQKAFDAVREYQFMGKIAEKGFDVQNEQPKEEDLCDGLKLRWTEQAVPSLNPYWVVRTTGDIMSDHNDIFNDKMVTFIRQMYTGFVAGRDHINEMKRGKGKGN